MKNTEHPLAEQWQKESEQMIVPAKELKKTLESLRKKKTSDFNWDVVVPKLYPKGLNVNVLDIITGKIDDIAEVIEEHDAAVEWFKNYHKKFGYDATHNLIEFYTNYEHAPDPNFNFDKMLEYYIGSTTK